MALEGFSIGGGTPTAAPAPAGGSSGNVSKGTGGSSALAGFSIGGGPPPNSSGAPVATTSPADPLMGSTPAPKDTSGFFSGFTGFLSKAYGSASRAISSATSAPTPDKLGSSVLGNTLKFLPSELARQIPGVAELQDHPELAKYITPREVAGSVPGAVAETAQGFVKAPIKAALDVYDAARQNVFGLDPNASFHVPGLGKVTSDVFDVTTRIREGEDPVSAALSVGGASILNALFFADIVNRVAGPRAVKVAETTGNVNDFQKPGTAETGPRVPIDAGPKTGRLYEAPTAYSKGGAQVLPPEVLARMKEQGVGLGKNFDPSQPVFLKVTVGKGGVYKGEVIQVKPSYLSTLYTKMTGTKAPTETLPSLLGAGSTIPETALKAPELAQAVEQAPTSEVTVLHSQEVKEADMVQGTNEAITKAQPPEPPAPLAQSEPTVATSLLISHNALRLLGQDTSRAHEGAAMIEREVRKHVAAHGADITSVALTEKLGIDKATADKLIAEVQKGTPMKPADVLAELTGGEQRVPGVDPKQPTKLSNEEATPLAEDATTRYMQKVITPSLRRGGPAVIGADDLKDFFGKDYNDNNHPVYSQAAYRVFEHALEKNPHPDVILTGGGPASGKTELLVKHLTEAGFTGTVYDSNMSNLEGVTKQIAAARAAGKNVDVYGVIPNLQHARSFSIKRENQIGRGISEATFARGHSGFPAVIEALLEKGILKPSEVHLLDTRNVHGIEAAKKMVAEGNFVKDPLAVLRKLDYNEQELKEVYAKKHFTKEGESTNGDAQKFHQARVRGQASDSPAEHGTDQVKTQKERVAEAVAEEPLSIKEVAKLTGILEPNVRRILGVGAKDGTFERVGEGVYVLKTARGNFAYVEMGDAEESLARMAKEGQSFDSVILDPAYYSRALIGGNRGIKQWNFIQAPQFASVMQSVSALVKHEDSHVYLMLSGARTAQPDMDKYVQGAIAADFKVVGEGTFTKLTQGGKPVTNVRGVEAAPERLILLTKSGDARKLVKIERVDTNKKLPVQVTYIAHGSELHRNFGSEIDAHEWVSTHIVAPDLNFRFVRPSIAKSYQTEKPAELMKALIEQSTLEDETVLDPFAGSGVTGAEALKAGRNAVLIEKQKETVENITKPRIEGAARDLTLKPEEPTRERTQGPGNTQVNVTEINGKRVETPAPLVSKTDLKNLIASLPEQRGDFKVIRNADNQIRMELDTDRGHMSLRPSALGLVESQIREGDVVHITSSDLKAKGTSFRVYNKDNKIEAMGSNKPASRTVKPDFSEEQPLSAYGPNDVVRLTDKVTGKSAERIVTRADEGFLVVMDDVSGIPYKASPEKFDIELVTKGDHEAPLPKRGPGINSPEMIALEKGEAKRPLSSGFINPGAIAGEAGKRIGELRDIVNHHQEVSDIIGSVSQSIYQAEGANKALKVRLTQLVTKVRDMSTPAEREAVYHYMEDHTAPLTDHARTTLLPIVEAMDKQLEILRQEARDAGIHITGDILGEHTPRNAMEKGGVIDKALDAYRAGKHIITNGGKLTTSVGSGSKHRVYHSLTDENGNRTVVAISKGKVLAIRQGVGTELGSTDKIITPKVKEFFDPSVRGKLEQLARDLGVTHERVATGASTGLGRSTAGVSFQGENLIKTRLSPDQVLAHEIGHQIDHKYGMQDFMNEERFDAQHKRELTAEMRALADKRFEGREVSDNFKSYVRKGSEKMAVMFEAYISNREMFKETAPHLYDDFRQFLADHAELRPFLDIRGSVGLEHVVHGGEHVAGITGGTFVANDGTHYTVGQATTREIEANTKTRYYKDPLANYALAIERTARAVRAMRVLTNLKESPQFKDAIIKEGERDIPQNFKTTHLPQFRGYWMEPRLAEAFDDMSKRQSGGVHIPIYDEVNNILISALVINPIMHFPNVGMGWGSQVAAAGFAPSVDFMKTFKQIINKDPEYIKWVEAGAPMQYLRQTNGEFADALLKDFTDQIKEDPTPYTQITELLGFANPIEWAKWLEKFSSDATWVGNDVMMFNALRDYQAQYKVTEAEAITEVSKRMADYRIPSRVLGSRALSLGMQNNAVMMFMRYHYSGVIKPWLTAVGESFDPRGSAAGGPTATQRFAALRTLAYFALMYFVWRLAINKPLAKLSGNPNTYMTMLGALKVIQNADKSLTLGSPSPLFTGVFALTPASKLLGGLLSGGYDISNFMKPIFGPGGEGVTAYLQNAATPYQAVAGAVNGKDSWTNFAASLGGVYTPKTTTPQAFFNTMLNVEKPQVEAKMKELIAKGETEKAQALAHAFNERLKAAIRNADKSNGNSGDDARVQYYFDTYPNGLGQKGYAIRMPSAQSMANYEARQGLTSGQKYLPGSGNKESEKGKPSDISNTTDHGTISQVLHGVTFYNRMTNASTVKKQMEGGTIIPDTQLDHILPLESGGGNETPNLQIVTTAQDAINQPVEDFTGREVKSGRMTLAQSREINIRFKAGLGQPLSPAATQEYVTKYSSRPLTLSQIYDYASTVPQ